MECRRKQDDCDLAEYCDGQSASCPQDNFAVNGLPCDGGLGYCYNGQCPQRPDQCVRMYGSGECPRFIFVEIKELIFDEDGPKSFCCGVIRCYTSRAVLL